jgi:hypothetical protein
VKTKVTPEYISSLVNFGPELQPEWKYNASDDDMRNAQARGSAGIYNILVDESIALLADEVGMGKTIQALSVCAALWKEKPEARILILAPREEVARNWIAEYSSFIKRHYKLGDDVVKAQLGGDPVNTMEFSHNLYSWVHNINLKWPKLMIGKTTSLSSIVSRRDVKSALAEIGITYNKSLQGLNTHEINQEVCKVLRKNMGESGKPIFDLLIIDEAHYYRNTHGGSLRVDAARILFGEPDSKQNQLAEKVLLLTATPNHSSSEDVKNIVSYFTGKFTNKAYTEILNKICIRRLRRLSKNGVTKYAYRNEVDLPADFQNDPLGELFFGLYHYQLVQKIEHGKRTGALKERGIDKLRSYLEGTEFIPKEKVEVEEVEEGEEGSESSEKRKKDKITGVDYNAGDDQDLLLDLSKSFKNSFGKSPNHPKYQALTNQIKLNGENKKALIFVRRIPSVYEINQRIVAEHNGILWNKLKELSVFKTKSKVPSRSEFRALLKGISDIEDTQELNPIDDNSDVSSFTIPSGKIWHSEVLELFVPKKDKENEKLVSNSTPASNFRERFEHSSTSPFALFFSPGPDYNERPYENLVLYKYPAGKVVVNNYYESALVSRIENYKAWKSQATHFISRRKPVDGSGEDSVKVIPTFFTLFWEIINKSEQNHLQLKAKYDSYSIIEKEALCNFIEKGLITGSDFIVDLFITFLKLNEAQFSQKEKDALNTYLLFCSEVKILLHNRKLINQVTESIMNFGVIYRKVFELYTEEKLFNYKWDDFTYLKVYPYSAANKNNSILKSFNTPFYPDYLVATSVLQEGVNLQYFCDNIYHYGAAWTPGDNEQRNGRIDRMFGLIERNLEAKNGDSTLDIFYPFLKDTVDESNLSNFFTRKNKEERLIDEGCGIDQNDQEHNPDDSSIDWTKYLRKPSKDGFIEPYSISHTRFKSIKTPSLKALSARTHLFLESIRESLREIKKFNIQFSFLGSSIDYGFVADPYLHKDNKERRQPVIIELIHDGIGTGLKGVPVYVLQMRTPLQSNRKWKEVRDKILSSKIKVPENIKVCLDNSSRSGNYWGIYLRADLPLFINMQDENPLSSEEISETFIKLVQFSDEIEKITFINQDIKKEEINLIGEDSLETSKNLFQASRGETKHDKWKRGNDSYYFQEEIKKFTGPTLTKDVWQLNHNYHYINFEENNNKIISKVFLYAKDSLKMEFDFLEEYSQVISKTINRGF